MRDAMFRIMPEMVRGFTESTGTAGVMEAMHGMMPRMMENCLTLMSRGERERMLTFCHKMLREMEERFLRK